MTAAFVIEARGRTAGIALRDDDRFLFFASDLLFKSLERQRFHSILDLRTVIETMLARDAEDTGGTAADDLRARPSQGWRRRRNRRTMTAEAAE